MHLLSRALIVMPFLCIAATCQAGAVEDTATQVKLGTLGLGIEGVWGLTPDALRVRLGANIGSLGQAGSLDSKGISYDATSHFKSLDALLDYHPFANDFRLTGGLFFNMNSYDIRARQPASGNYTFNGNDYSTSQVGSLQGKLSFNKLAPYFGLGLGDALGNNQRFTVMADFGFLYQGKPSLELNGAGSDGSNTALAQDLEVYREQAESGFNHVRWLPVLSVGITYKW